MRLICLFLWCLATPLLAQDSPPQALATGDSGRAWQAVGRVDVAGKGFCTGSLIGPALVLTAAHCVAEEGAPVDPVRLRFRAGLRGSRFVAERQVRRVAMLPETVAALGELDQHIAHDLALLELERAVRLPGVRPFDMGAPSRRDQRVAAVTYGGPQGDIARLQRACTVLGRSESVAVLSCDVDFGASGAPVLHQGRLAAMIAAMAEMDGARVALAVDLAQAVPRLRARLARGEAIGRSDARRKVVRP